ncbi:MAG: hypothetical protein HPY73_03305 [Methanomassiliicoccales archaeon]|nr:MAG: hypothetical protein HPY73_03305 [Methanomassiliicoccales archaeon]
MPYRIPPAKILSQSISEVIRSKGTVISQRKFSELVNANLRKKDPEYVASEERIRRMAIFKNLAKLHIHYRETKEPSDHGECPVCRSETKEIRNQTLSGENVRLGYRCTRCPYWTGPNKRIPVRYTFIALQQGVIEPAPKKRRKGDERYAQWKFA